MSTIPSSEGEARVYPAKPVELVQAEGNCCGACGWWVTGGADPTVMATHRCDDAGDEYDGGYHDEPTITDTITGQGVL